MNKSETEERDERLGIAIMLRVGDAHMAEQLQQLAAQHKLSMNMTVVMLLGYAFNEIERTGKRFTPKVVFESE